MSGIWAVVRMSSCRKAIIGRLTYMIVRIEALYDAVVSLEWIRPPSVHRTEEHEARHKVQGQVMIGHKVVFE